MGRYQPKPKLYQLRFEDHPGFEVTMRGLSIDGFMSLARSAAKTQGLDMSALKGPELEQAMDDIDGLFTRFAASLKAWNLDDENGRPVGADLRCQRASRADGGEDDPRPVRPVQVPAVAAGPGGRRAAAAAEDRGARRETRGGR